MATEGILLHDGTQTIAAANYGNGANLAGSNTAGTTGGSTGSGQFLCVGISTAAARTSLLASAAGQQIYGVLQNKPAAGQAADVGIFGITKIVVGTGGSTFGLPQMTTTAGAVTDWTTGSGKVQIGVALETGVAGQLITMFLYGGQQKLLT
jgi:hypothetical protein